MSINVNLGGDRIGSGAKMKQTLHGFERSTHDLQYIWRSTMAPGTIVPFMSMVALPEDTWDIDLNCNVLTHPTIGPLFASYKVQLDVYWAAVRLYQAMLHNNAAQLGNDMASVKLPLLEFTAKWDPEHPDLENSQSNPSGLLAYLGYRGAGATTDRTAGTVKRYFNAVPYFMYWDVYKNFYANKQEEIGYYIHSEPEEIVATITSIAVVPGIPGEPEGSELPQAPGTTGIDLRRSSYMSILFDTTPPIPDQIMIVTSIGTYPANQVFSDVTIVGSIMTFQGTLLNTSDDNGATLYQWKYRDPGQLVDSEPKLVSFPLTNIDSLRKQILTNVFSLTAYVVNEDSQAPIGGPLKEIGGFYSKMSSQEGLGIKTYQSDIFNNWLNKEWVNAVNTKATVSTAGDSFNIESLIMANKVYDHFNRVAASDGTYASWLRVTWDSKPYMGCIAPEYMGGLSKELVFQEVISNAAAGDGTQPLGTLAGRGTMGRKHKGGRIRIGSKGEIGYIMGMVSLTPRIDYSQGNTWDVSLLTMDDFHKPIFDQIGFQDLTTDKMYWPETTVNGSGTPTFRSAGKTVAWIDYQTNYNKVFGNFAIAGNEMFMTLNRKYEPNPNGTIKDLTTYVDPVKSNQIFAYTKRDAQNFWVQIGIGCTVRRKMSAKQIPNL